MLKQLVEASYPKRVMLKDGSEVVVRAMTTGDKDGLLQLFRGIPEEDRLYLREDILDEQLVERWFQELNYDKVLPLLAEAHGRIVADVTLHQERRGWMSHVGKVRVVVHPDYRRKGLATLLISEVIQIGVGIGLNRLDGEFMAEQTGPMRACEKMGFVKVATLPGHVKDLRGFSHDLVVFTYDLQQRAWRTLPY